MISKLKRKEYLVILFLTLIWGSAFSFIKVALETFTPFQLVLARFLPVLPIFLVSIYYYRLELSTISKKDWMLLTIGGFFAVVGYSIALFTGQSYAPASIASLVISLNPPTIIAGAILLRGEKVSKFFLIGVLVAFIGMIILSMSRERIGFDINMVTGIVILLGCPISWGAYTLLLTNVVKRLPPILASSLSVVIGSIMLLPTIPFAFREGVPQFGIGWIYALYLGIFSTYLGYIFWNWLLLKRGAARTGIIVYLNTLWGVLLAIIWLEEPMTWQIMIGAGCILLGVAVAKRFG